MDNNQKYLLDDFSKAKMITLGSLLEIISPEIVNPLSLSIGSAKQIQRNLNKEKNILKTATNNKKIEELNFNSLEAIELVNNGNSRLKNIVSYLQILMANNKLNYGYNVKSGIKNCISLFNNIFRLQNIDVKVSLEKVPNINCNPTDINQIVSSLLINCIDALPNGGLIEMICRKNKFFLEITVIDSGAGVNKEIKHKIFEPFFTTKSEERRTGLGLYVAKEILKNIGGDIIYCDGDVGATFKVKLPLKEIINEN